MFNKDYNLIKTKLNIININNYTAIIVLYPLNKGFGNTIGNSIRRVLLSSIPGYAITEIEINNILHEFSGINGVKEDIVNIMLNIKEVSIKLLNKNSIDLKISKNIIGEVFAYDIKSDDDFIIYNPNKLICNITDNIDLEIKMKANSGIGYINDINEYYKKNNEISNSNKLYINSIFNPIKNVSYKVENAKYDKFIDLDKLIINITTNGVIEPLEAVKYAANILNNHFNIFNKENVSIKENNINILNKNIKNEKLDLNNKDSIIYKLIENLDLTIRSYNCLKSNSIIYIEDLINKTENDLLKIKNFGKKSLLEIKNILLKYKLNLKK